MSKLFRQAQRDGKGAPKTTFDSDIFTKAEHAWITAHLFPNGLSQGLGQFLPGLRIGQRIVAHSSQSLDCLIERLSQFSVAGLFSRLGRLAERSGQFWPTFGIGGELIPGGSQRFGSAGKIALLQGIGVRMPPVSSC